MRDDATCDHVPTPTMPPSEPEKKGTPSVAGSAAHDPGLTTPVESVDVTASDPLRQLLPEYELLGELGRGGMGVVYKARQTRLNRIVALKTLLDSSPGGTAGTIRFLAEAEAVAAIHHPYVVQVYEFGEHDGRPFFAMEFLSGGSLQDQLRRRCLPPPTDAAILVAKIARGVQAAHAQQIVHRDLKPGNVLFDVDGEPKVTDFGLARRGLGAGLTRTQAVMGTPAYMAPEQARGDAKFVGPAADVYALGAVLYECLTGSVPFPGNDALVILQRVAQEEPERPQRRNPGVPRDLELVCLKCLEKEPGQRYQSAAALADDLERYTQGLPIRARPVGAWERGWKWVRRHPTTAALVVASTVAVLSLVAFGVGQSYQAKLSETNADLQSALTEADRLRGRVEEQRQQTASALLRVERFRYPPLIALVQRELAANDLGRAEELLEACPAGLRGWEWSYLAGQAHVSRTLGRKHTGRVLALAYSPDGERLAAGASDGSVRIRDESVWREKTVVIRAHTGSVRAVALSSDGLSLATAGEDGTVRLWELTNRKDAFQPNQRGSLFRAGAVFRHAGPILGLAYSPDGRRLAWCGEDGVIRMWVAGDKEPRDIGRHDGSARAVAFHPDGQQLASAGTDRMVRVWDVTGKHLFNLGPHVGPVVGIAWRPDGEQLAAAVDEPGHPGEVVVWEAAKQHQVRTLTGPAGGVLGVAYLDPAGRIVATARDGSIRLWEPGGEPGAILKGTTTPTTAPAALPDGKSVAVGGGEPNKGEVTIWDLSQRSADRVLRGHAGGTNGLDFTTDGQRLVSAGRDGLVKVWDLSSGRDVLTFRGHEGSVAGVAASRDLLVLASAGSDGTVRLWDIPTGESLHVLKGNAGPATAVAFTPDGKSLASTHAAGTSNVWDVASGSLRFTISGHAGAVTSVAISPDGKWIATGGADRTVRIYDAAGGREVRVCRGHTAGVAGLAFSPESTRLASCGLDRTVRVWDSATGEQIHALSGHAAGVSGVSFSEDGRRLASAGADGTVRLWDTETGLEVFTLQAHPRGATGVAFAPGGRLAASTVNGLIKLWEANTQAGNSSAFDHDD